MSKLMTIFVWIVCSLAWIALVWVLVSLIEIPMHNLDSCCYSDWNLFKIIVENVPIR